MNDPDFESNAQSNLTHEAICQLPHLERIPYVELIRVRYPLWEKLYNKLQRRHKMKPIAAEPQCMLLVGPAGAGKTTLAASYARRFPAIFPDTLKFRLALL